MKEKPKTKKPVKHSEMPTRERQQHDGGFRLEAVDQNYHGDVTCVRARAKQTHILDWYVNVGSIDDQMRRAGMEFHRAFFYAGKMPQINVMFTERVQNAKNDCSIEDHIDQVSAAEAKLNQAFDHLTPTEIDVVWDVAGLGLKAGSVKRTQTLKYALRALAGLWQIAPV